MAFHVAAAAAAALVGAGAVGAAYFFGWPVAAPAAAGMMKATGAVGYYISRAAFLQNPQCYFHLLRTAGAKAAAAAFALVM